MEPEYLHAPSSVHLGGDIDAALVGLRRAFPAICIWFGDFSGSLWAFLPDRLVEAKNAAGLTQRLHTECDLASRHRAHEDRTALGSHHLPAQRSGPRAAPGRAGVPASSTGSAPHSTGQTDG